MENNAYLLTSSDDHLVLVDAATEPATLLEWIGPRTLDAVITTHQHFDHIGALAAVVEATGATPWCGGPDAASIAEQTGVQCRTVWTGDTLLVGDEALEVIGLVGHTPGSIALVLPTNPTVLITGDSLFPGAWDAPRTTTSSIPCSATSPRSSSTASAMTRSCCRATGSPRPWAPSAPTYPNGVPAAGEATPGPRPRAPGSGAVAGSGTG